MSEVDGVNAGYARLLLDEYLDNPEAVPAEWRALFEDGDSALVRELPGLARLLERLPADGNGKGRNGAGTGDTAVAGAPDAPAPPPLAPVPAAAAPPPAPAPPVAEPAREERPAAAAAPDRELLGGVAAAMALIKAHRMHGHLAA